MKYKVAIFDFDGTLADSLPWFITVVNQIAERYDFKPIQESDHRTLRGYDARKVLQHLGIPLWKVPLIAREMRQRMTGALEHILLFEGIGGLLEELSRRGIILVVVSSNSVDNIRRVLGPRNAALIRHYECGASLFGKGKKFRKVLKACGVAPSEAICIGDEIRDLQAARGEKIPFGAVTWGYTTPESIAACSPDELFITVDEIATKLA